MSRYATGHKNERLRASKDILALAQKTLGREEIEEAESLSRMLVGNRRERRKAIGRLLEIVSPPPKRPLYYTQHEILDLPRWTRDPIRYLGDYVDKLGKHALFEVTRDPRDLRQPFGAVISGLQKKRRDFTEDLVLALYEFNWFVYRDAKHGFDLPRGRVEHRFTSREAVNTAFVAIAMARRITALSPRADRVDNDLDPGVA